MGRALIAVGAVIWLAALVAAIRDRKARRLTRIATVVILLGAAVAAVILYTR